MLDFSKKSISLQNETQELPPNASLRMKFERPDILFLAMNEYAPHCKQFLDNTEDQLISQIQPSTYKLVQERYLHLKTLDKNEFLDEMVNIEPVLDALVFE